MAKLRMIKSSPKKGKGTYNPHHKNLCYHIEKEIDQTE
jgi:hypothetical protein